MALLELDNVHVSFRGSDGRTVNAVRGVSLSVGPGQIVGLVGESGCGKTSLARAAVGLHRPSAGTVLFEGQPVDPIGWRKRSEQESKLQMVFQSPFASLNPRRRVGDQISDGIPHTVRAEQRRATVVELLVRVGLDPDSADRLPHQFSGGQLQRIALARSLSSQPTVIVADEPVTALDATAQMQVITVLASLVRELGMGLLLISHDLALVQQIADVVAVMYLGRIVEKGARSQVWDSCAHPYTRALIDAVPMATADAVMPKPLMGEVPDPANIPSGCSFRPRCAYAFDSCHADPPVVAQGGHQVACWLSVSRGPDEEPAGAVPASVPREP